MTTKYYILLLIFLSLSILKAQHPETQRIMLRIYKHAGYKKAIKDPLNAKRVYIKNYTDSVFPNDNILQFKNIECLAIDGGFIMKKGNDSVRFPLIRIDTSKLKQLKNLKYLSLVQFDFNVFPEGICTISQLKGLTLAICKIRSISPSISRLSELNYFECRLNELKTLPGQLFELKKLEVLDIGNNKFEELPAEIVRLPALTILNFSNIESKKFRPATSQFPFEMNINKINCIGNYAIIKQLMISKHLKKLEIDVCKENNSQPFYEMLRNDGFLKKITIGQSKCN